uniref:Zf-C2HC5 domain-containing protein n=1 Tax=Syphacia muris TaxID=451379 RepID=A0A0N5ALP6_9BILA
MHRKDTNHKNSLKSVADNFNIRHIRAQKKDRKVTSKEASIKTIRPGRHLCDCQARVHELIRNCSNCGRIVCEQEGSGPCLFCGHLVCTREEQKILEAENEESEKLLMSLTVGGNKDTKNMWSRINTALVDAVAFKEKLLIADADREKATAVNDLDSDYYSLENDMFLTKQERETIIARKEELREMRGALKKAVIIDFDLEHGVASEAKKQDEQFEQDPIIQAVFQKARQRHIDSKSKNVKSNWVPKDFKPQYPAPIANRKKMVQHDAGDSDNLNNNDEYFCRQFNDLLYSEVERKGFTFALEQPVASLLAVGIRRHILWKEDVYLRGPVLIAAHQHQVSTKIIEDEVNRCRNLMGSSSYNKKRDFPLSYPIGAIVGRALLVDCLSSDEYNEQYPDGEVEPKSDDYVLVFSTFEPLLAPVPHIPPSSDFYQIDKLLLMAIKQILDPYSLS